MKILALLTPAAGKTPADFGPLVVAEEKRSGPPIAPARSRELHSSPEPLTVSLVFEAADHAAVEAALKLFPMVAAGLLDIRLVTLGPWTMWRLCSTRRMLREHLIGPGQGMDRSGRQHVGRGRAASGGTDPAGTRPR